jgi:hypothetical protein
MEQMQGTPITRSGGYLIRVGWRAAGYSVDSATETRYQTVKILFGVLAILAGLATVYGVEYLLFDILDPLVGERTRLIREHPGLWRLMIYMATLLFGVLIYLQLLVMVGNHLVKGHEKRDDGFSFLAQRRRAAFSKKREYLAAIIGLVVIWALPMVFNQPLQLVLTLILLVRIGEGLLIKKIS